jgi:hypothetical protein
MSLVQAPVFQRIHSSSTSSLVNTSTQQQKVSQQQQQQQHTHQNQQQKRLSNHESLNASSMSYQGHGQRRMPRPEESAFNNSFGGSQSGFSQNGGVTDSPRSSSDRNGGAHGMTSHSHRPASYQSTFAHQQQVPNVMQKSLDNHHHIQASRGHGSHENGPTSYASSNHVSHNYSLPAYNQNPADYKHPFIQQHQRANFNSSPHSIQPSTRSVQPSPRSVQPSPRSIQPSPHSVQPSHRQNDRRALPNPSPRVPTGPTSNRSHNQYSNSPHLTHRHQTAGGHAQSVSNNQSGGANFGGQMQSPPSYNYAVSQTSRGGPPPHSSLPQQQSSMPHPHSSLPATQLSSVQDYRPVYNSMAGTSTATPKTGQR